MGRVAHQLGLHGIIAPAATGLGETLALFEQHLPADELPHLVGDEVWEQLPPDLTLDGFVWSPTETPPHKEWWSPVQAGRTDGG